MTGTAVVESVACDLCGEERFVVLPRKYVYAGVDCHHARCSSCGLVRVNPRPRFERMRGLYTRDYFERGGFVGGFSDPRTLSRFTLIKTIIEAAGIRKRALLEIGCADGYFLNLMREHGWEVSGAEISEYASAKARSRGLAVFTGSIEDCALPAESFGCAYMGDVLEHLPSPRSALRAVSSLLEPSGALVIDVPVFYNSLYGRASGAYLNARRFMSGKTHTMRDEPLHLHEFTCATLFRLLRSCGYEVSGARFPGAPGFIPRPALLFCAGRVVVVARKGPRHE